MRSVLKVLLYAALLAACYWCGFSAYQDYSMLMMDDGTDLTRAAKVRSGKGTNAPATTVEGEVVAPASNAPPVKPAGIAPAAAAPPEGVEEIATVRTNRRVGLHYMHLLGYTLGFASALLVLGFVAAQDFGHLLKFRFGKEVSYVDARSARQANYEQAEQVALKGQHREAIRLLEAIIAKHPNHVHSILRVAELYDKELHDYQNAALHYENLLKQKIPPEQWGWVAIHLANIYSGKLSQPEAAIALVSRLATEYPETQAGAKALKRMALIAKAGLDPDAGKDV